MDVKSFAGFVLEAAKLNIRPAKSIAVYIKSRKESKGSILFSIKAALHAEKIDLEYHDILREYVEQCFAAYQKTGRLVDVRDPKDWRGIGNGARMRKVHKDSDQI